MFGCLIFLSANIAHTLTEGVTLVSQHYTWGPHSVQGIGASKVLHFPYCGDESWVSTCKIGTLGGNSVRTKWASRLLPFPYTHSCLLTSLACHNEYMMSQQQITRLIQENCFVYQSEYGYTGPLPLFLSLLL